MAYVANRLSLLQGTIGGSNRLWVYFTSDSVATMTAAGYITDASNKRMQRGDIVMAFTGTLNTSGPDASPSTAARGTVSEFMTSAPTFVFLEVSSISSGAATLQGVSADLSSGIIIGATTSSTIGFYGVTPAAQPTSSLEAAVASTAAGSTAATFWGYTTSTQANAIPTLLNQIRSDLVTLGLIKGS